MHLSLPCTPDSECVLRTTLGCLSGLVTCFMHHILHAMLFSLSFFFWVFNSPAVQSQLHSIIISWHVSAILLPPFPLLSILLPTYTSFLCTSSSSSPLPYSLSVVTSHAMASLSFSHLLILICVHPSVSL